MYFRLAKNEEREVKKEYGQLYLEYAAHVPAFIPKLKKETGAHLKPK
jgi:protein-S-isoprenylcysteine O-methyltransferase Ste14